MADPRRVEVERPVEAMLPAAGALLVRIPVTGPGWPRVLPSVPRPHTVTATVGDHALAAVPADDLVASGYRLVGVHPARLGGGSVVDVLVPRELQEQHPAFATALLDRAARVFHLDLGPVRDVLGAELEQHLARQAAVGPVGGDPAP